MTWIQDIAWGLNQSTLSIGYATTSTAARSIFIQNRPSTSDTCIVLYPYAGLPPDWSQDRKRTQNPRLNVLVVSTATDGGWQKSQDIITCLDRVVNSPTSSSTSGTTFKEIQALQEPEWLGKDEHGNGNFVINFQVSY